MAHARSASRSMKRCSRCGETKPVSEFNLDNRRGTYQRYCRACNLEYIAEYRRTRLDVKREMPSRRFHADKLIFELKKRNSTLVKMYPDLFKYLATDISRKSVRRFSLRWFLNRFTEKFEDWDWETLAEITESILMESKGHRRALQDVRMTRTGRELIPLLEEAHDENGKSNDSPR